MEFLENELSELRAKLKDKEAFEVNIDSLTSIYPFSKYEYIISKLLTDKILSFNDYLNLRDDYIERNLFLYVFELTGPRSFGDTWALSHLTTIEPLLTKATRKKDPLYNGEYDMILPYQGSNIKIEVKASRAVDRAKNDMPLYQKALSSSSKEDFLMNFQQLKPSCCDVFIWLAVYRDKVRYWVMKNTAVTANPDFCPQHRNEETATRIKQYDKSSIFEGQIMIHKSNIGSISDFEVDSRQIRQAIIAEFERN